MKPAFVLVCYLSGLPAGTMYLASVNNCNYYKDRLTKQEIKIQGEIKKYDCYCKLVNVNKDMRLY